jgi:predicted adenine nucleotide alpha hydrolase (AANH) superfamily ATPase
VRQVVFHEKERCVRCYEMRLTRSVDTAVTGGFDAWTTTLLYSKYQNHRLLQERGAQLAAERGVGWHGEDFRLGWQQGIDESVRMGLYRQPYCGCIYSEQERFDKQLRKRGR